MNLSELTQPKTRGGLSIRRTRGSNEALLGKLVHSLLNEKEKFGVQVLSEKYLQSGLILVESPKLGNSYVWRGILKAKDDVPHGFGVKLGASVSSFWYTNWLGTGQLVSRVPFVHISDTALTVADVSWYENRHLAELYTQLPHEIRDGILRVPTPPVRTGEETILWMEANNGRYPVRSTYNLLIDDG